MRSQLLLTLGLFLVFGTGNLSAQDPSDWLEEVRPELEKILGSFPRVKLSLSSFLSRQDDPDLAACIKWRWPHLKDEALACALEDAKALTASAAVVRLFEGTNVILIRPEHKKDIAGWDKDLAKADSADFFRLALIHETVRYVLDSRYDLAKRRQACQDGEEWFALEALIEGRAQWVTRQVARKLGKEEFFPLLAERFLHVPDQDKDPELRTISQSVVQKRYWAYQQGLAFFDFLETQGLGDVEKQVFSKPPKLTKWIEEPELYVKALQSKRPDLATLLAKLEKTPPPATPGWRCSSNQQAWTPEMIKEVAGIFGHSELGQKVIDSWKDGRSLIWCSSWTGKAVVQCPQSFPVGITLTRLETTEAARSYYFYALELQRKRLANEEFKEEDLKLAGIAEGRKLGATLNSKICRTTTYLVRWDDTVIEISWYGTTPNQSWTEQIIAVLRAADN